MKNWTTEGHLSELALELWAAREAEDQELQTFHGHIQRCQGCQARATEWRGLLLSLASLQGAQPSESFSDRVMERVRVVTPTPPPTRARLAALALKLRPVAAAAAAVWTVAVVGGIAWLGSRLDVPAGALLARLVGYASDLLLGVTIKIGALLHLSNLAETLVQFQETVPGLGLAAAVALMALVSGAAIWTLHRVTNYQPTRADVHG